MSEAIGMMEVRNAGPDVVYSIELRKVSCLGRLFCQSV
jgi:hypothetical protein